MTLELWARVFIALLSSVTAVWVFTLMRRRRREGNTHAEDQTRRMLWILSACAVALILSIDPIGRRLGALVGQPFLPDHLKHLIDLAAVVHAVAAVENLSGSASRHRPSTLATRIRQAWPVIGLVMVGCYVTSPNHYDLVEMERGLGGWTGTIYWTAFMGYFLAACIPFTVHCLRFARESRVLSPRRSGVAFLGIGGVAGCFFGGSKLVVAFIESGEKLRNLTMSSARWALVVAFVTICYGCWRSRGQARVGFERWARKVGDLTRARWLRPMDTALHQASPDASAQLAVASPALRLATRETAVRDGIAELAPWMDPRDLDMIRRTLAAQRDDDALVITTAIELARRRKLDGLSPLLVEVGELHHDDGPMLQRMAAAWPAALDLADVVEAAHLPGDDPQGDSHTLDLDQQLVDQHFQGEHVAR